MSKFEVIKEVKRIESDETQYTRTTWTYGGYQLTLRKGDEADAYADWNIGNDRDLPGLSNQNISSSEGVDYGVNWSALGTKTPEEAVEYAEKLVHAADAAKVFTKIRNEEG